MKNDEHILNYQELVDDYININDWRVKENSTVTTLSEVLFSLIRAR
jgi:hypothetical protein